MSAVIGRSPGMASARGTRDEGLFRRSQNRQMMRGGRA
jgi:hypothetical protein